MYSDADDRYRSRYLELVQEVQAKEAAWNETTERVQRVMNGLIGLVRRPMSPELDAGLARLAERTAGGAELAELEGQLTTLQELAPTHSPPGTEPEGLQRIHQILTGLVKGLHLPQEMATARAQLLEFLGGSGPDPDALCTACEKVVGLVQSVEERVRSGRRELEEFLLELTGKLATLDHGLTSAQDEVVAGIAAAKSCDKAMGDEVRKLAVGARDLVKIEDLRGATLRAVESISRQIASRQSDDRARELRLAKEVEGLQRELGHLETEVDEYRKKNQQIMESSLRDPLTGVHNRLAYQERAQVEYARWQRYHHPLSVLMLDLDLFKTINDTLGHRAGDLVLQQVARIAQQMLRKADFLARYGGEEFVALLPDTPLAAAVIVAEKLRCAVEGFRFHHKSERIPVTLSCGVAELADADTIESALERADQALYVAKRTGRNRCVSEDAVSKE